MKKRMVVGIVAALVLVGGATAAYVVSPTVHAGKTGESPELGRPGAHNIGTVEEIFSLEARTKITAWGAVSGNLADTERKLSVRFWYPANTGGGKPAQYDHIMRPPGKDPISISSKGFAVSGATPIADETFPLVVMSHGFGGWNTQFSNLAEHIASHGYVVASIDHADMPIDGAVSFFLSFGNVLADRSLDQRQIIDQIVRKTEGGSTGYAAQIDAENIGLVGYSMGGYGALATAGASYDFSTDPMSSIPDVAKEAIEASSKQAAPIKALVAIAPWGGQPDNRAWTVDSLAKINQPTLVITGNQDDVVNFKDGVQWLFENITSANRHMLVFREARHNIVGNKFDLDPETDFSTSEFLKEPVWRSDRINAVNQHFVTAFLDLNLKKDESKAVFLNVPSPNANDSQWPLSFGEQLNGKLAGPEQKDHWAGFQRRWAVGLEMHHLEKQQ